jgi:hypothetical protein
MPRCTLFSRMAERHGVGGCGAGSLGHGGDDTASAGRSESSCGEPVDAFNPAQAAEIAHGLEIKLAAPSRAIFGHLAGISVQVYLPSRL